MCAVENCTQILGGLAARCQAWVRARVALTRESRISFLLAGVLRQLTVRPTRLITAWALLRDSGQSLESVAASQWMCCGVVAVAGRDGPRVRTMGVYWCCLR